MDFWKNNSYYLSIISQLGFKSVKGVIVKCIKYSDKVL